MVRRYIPKRPSGDPSMRRARVVELRATGLSLRKIAARLHISEGTVRNDLKAAAAEQECVIPLRKTAPERGQITHPDYAPGPERSATVTPIRRTS